MFLIVSNLFVNIFSQTPLDSVILDKSQIVIRDSLFIVNTLRLKNEQTTKSMRLSFCWNPRSEAYYYEQNFIFFVEI